MGIIALIVSLMTLITVLLGGIYAKRYASETIRGSFTDLSNYFTQKNGEGLTIIDEICQGLAAQITDTIENKLRAASMAHNSHLSRQANLLEQDMTEDYINSQAPALGLILNAVGPKTKQRLLKNPTAVEYILPKLQGMFNLGGNHQVKDDDAWVKRLHGK